MSKRYMRAFSKAQIVKGLDANTGTRRQIRGTEAVQTHSHTQLQI